MRRRSVRTGVRVAVSFALALTLVFLFVSALGARSVAAQLAAVNVPVFVLGPVAATVALLAWSESLRRLLGRSRTDGGVGYRLAFLGGDLAKQLLPFGRVGGPAVLAYTVSGRSETDYAETLAAITLAEFLNLGVSLLLATVGFVALLSRGAVPHARTFALALLVALAIGVALLLLGRSGRDQVEHVVLGVASALRPVLGRVAPGLTSHLSPMAVRGRLDAYYRTFGRLARDRRRLAGGALFALAGWTCYVLPLYVGFRALGHSVPLLVLLFVVPVGGLANVVPLPGGLGSYEIALTGVLVAVVGLDVHLAAAGVLLYRLSTYWFVVLLEGLASLSLSTGLTDALARDPSRES